MAKLKILVIHGANLVYQGKRSPELYGTTTTKELDLMIKEHSKKNGYQLDAFYTNIEGDAINKIYDAATKGCDGIVMNPGGFTYCGYALRDCIKGVNLPCVEIHWSNLLKRNIHSVLAEAAIGVIAGFGADSYLLGLDAMLKILNYEPTSREVRPSRIG